MGIKGMLYGWTGIADGGYVVRLDQDLRGQLHTGHGGVWRALGDTNNDMRMRRNTFVLEDIRACRRWRLNKKINKYTNMMLRDGDC